MVRVTLRFLIIIFVLESSWAAAAQYCRHELGLNVQHFGHHTHQHRSSDQSAVDQNLVKADDTSSSTIDSDCPFCHLGVMKSMVSMMVIAPSTADPPHLTDIVLTYPHIVPRQLERPNWLLAA